MSWWDFPRAPGAVRALVAAGEARGLTRDRCLQSSGIAPADLEDPELVVEGGQEVRVMRNLLAAVGDLPGFGAEVGRRARLGSFGIWGYAVLTSPTFADAVRLGVRFARLSFAFTAPVVHERLPRIDLSVAEIPDDLRDFACERDMASILVLFSTVAPGVTPQLTTHLSDARAAALAAVLPGLRVRSGRPEDSFVFDPADWAAPLPQAHVETMRACVDACTALLERRMARRGTSARVRARLLERPDVKPTMAMVASDLHMEERTLRRHLVAEGTSFSELLDEVHETLATQLLALPSMTVEEVARRLGYADGPTFSHAFKRWTGTSPSVWRTARHTQP
ncbi:MAG TPA: AraC family transcriptional regulator [Acidimicrobiia bacterium]|nr:AraC family transcriptional regulator [Acidimicrobiia bacterium]